MKQWIVRSLLASMTLALCGAASPPAQDSQVKLTKQDNRIVITIDGKPFTDYYYGPEGGRPYVRPFMFPVRAADGTIVTSDQSQVPKGDHPHHRSLWVAFGNVNGVDHWLLAKGADQPRQRHLGFDRIEGNTLVEELAWEDASHEPMMKEKRTVRFFAYPDGNRGIDITSQFQALDKPVKFGDTKEAGLCAVRLNAQIAKDPIITLSSGATSTHNGKSKKQPSDESNVWGKQATWCDQSGQIDGKTYGVAVLDSPQNPLPAKWHVRRYGLLAANNIGASAFDKNNPASYTPFTIQPGKLATFNFRVVVHEGTAAKAQIAQKYQAYADSPPSSPAPHASPARP